jgi:hypothetical protein
VSPAEDRGRIRRREGACTETCLHKNVTDPSDPRLFALFGEACALEGEAGAELLTSLARKDPALARQLRALLEADTDSDDAGNTKRGVAELDRTLRQ